MTLRKRGVVFGMALALLGGLANAQKLEVNPDPLVAGGQAVIEYSDASKAGQTVTVTIVGPGFPNVQVETVTIPLDSHGNGTVKWPVPHWPWASFNAPNCRELTRPITDDDLQLAGVTTLPTLFAGW
jgi:hypothetical protein